MTYLWYACNNSRICAVRGVGSTFIVSIVICIRTKWTNNAGNICTYVVCAHTVVLSSVHTHRLYLRIIIIIFHQLQYYLWKYALLLPLYELPGWTLFVSDRAWLKFSKLSMFNDKLMTSIQKMNFVIRGVMIEHICGASR